VLPVSKCLKNWNLNGEVISVVVLSDGSEWLKWVWHDGEIRFEEHLELEAVAQELEAYYKHTNLAAFIGEYQAQGN